VSGEGRGLGLPRQGGSQSGAAGRRAGANYLASTYGSAGEFLSDALILKDQKTYSLKAFQKPDSYFTATKIVSRML
jgi:hypothetical protein